MIRDVPHCCRQRRKPVCAPILSRVWMQQVLRTRLANDLIDLRKRIAQIGHDFCLALGRIRTAKIAALRRLLTGYLLGPGLIAASYVLYLLSEGAHVLV